jgi:agmatine deiminase
LSKQDAEAQLGDLLGLTKIIWLPGIAGHDITDGHTDFYARFAGPGVVVAGLDTDPASYDHDVTQRHLDILKSATDARGRPLRVEVITAPTRLRDESAGAEFAAGYINFYVCNGGVIAPSSATPRPTPPPSPRCGACSRTGRSSSSTSTASPPAGAASTAPPSRSRL